MLLAGLGWGNMPFHMVEDDIERGTVEDHPTGRLRTACRVMGCAYLTGDRLGR
jgi:hypothetical protein